MPPPSPPGDLLKIKLQLRHGAGYAFGPGKADLLAAIEREGSISGGGRALGMSYRRAWLLVDEMNRCFVAPLVATLKGGGRERGARLTEAGREVLTAYRELEAAAAGIADHPAYTRLVGNLRESPTILPPGRHAELVSASTSGPPPIA